VPVPLARCGSARLNTFYRVRALETHLSGPVLVEPVVHGDERGFFLETYRRGVMAELGIEDELVQHNHSRSRRGIVRGMHFQSGMGKLVQCVRGSIFDVLVDIRRGSPNFGRWEGFTLDDHNHHQLWCPDGFAHGFCVVSEFADVVYGCSAYHDPTTEGGFRYDDPEVGIEWPADLALTPSARDRSAPSLSDIAATLPFAYA
jgi:dTDP-4-dehydrorhamnose 3,5-epimerase